MRTLTTYKSPLYDIDGSVMGTVGVGIDVTNERAYEGELVKKNRALEKIFTSMDCGIICHTVDGSRILNINNTASSFPPVSGPYSPKGTVGRTTLRFPFEA